MELLPEVDRSALDIRTNRVVPNIEGKSSHLTVQIVNICFITQFCLKIFLFSFNYQTCCDIFNVIHHDRDVTICKLQVKRHDVLLTCNTSNLVNNIDLKTDLHKIVKTYKNAFWYEPVLNNNQNALWLSLGIFWSGGGGEGRSVLLTCNALIKKKIYTK